MIIRYHSEFVKVTGSINAAILMSKLEYWFKVKEGKTFYKFLAPCEHECYRQGDSWTEELIMSLSEVRFAFKRIGVAYKSKKAFRESPDLFQGKLYASYYDRIRKRTYYLRNHELVERILKENSMQIGFEDKQEMDFSHQVKVKAGKVRSEISRNDETQSRLSNKDFNNNCNIDNNKDSKGDNQKDIKRDRNSDSKRDINKEDGMGELDCKMINEINHKYSNQAADTALDKYNELIVTWACDECKNKYVSMADETADESENEINYLTENECKNETSNIARNEYVSVKAIVPGNHIDEVFKTTNDAHWSKAADTADYKYIDEIDDMANSNSGNKFNEHSIPFAEICEMYNSFLGETLGKKAVLSNYEKKCLEEIWQDFDLIDFKEAFEKTAASKFLCGKTDRSQWKASLAWLLNKENMDKVLSGKYDEPKKRRGGVSEKVKSFLEMDRHGWDFDEIEALEMRLIDQKIAHMNDEGIGTDRW